jgi:hypothetical protein
VSTTKPTSQQILDTLMDPDDNDAAAGSIREYLTMLLEAVWREQEGFSGKRPFGNSGWGFELYKPLMRDGHIIGALDEDGYIEELADDQRDKADNLIAAAIQSLAGEASPEFVALQAERDRFARAIANVVVLGKDRLSKEAQDIVAELLRLDRAQEART